MELRTKMGRPPKKCFEATGFVFCAPDADKLTVEQFPIGSTCEAFEFSPNRVYRVTITDETKDIKRALDEAEYDEAKSDS